MRKGNQLSGLIILLATEWTIPVRRAASKCSQYIKNALHLIQRSRKKYYSCWHLLFLFSIQTLFLKCMHLSTLSLCVLGYMFLYMNVKHRIIIREIYLSTSFHVGLCNIQCVIIWRRRNLFQFLYWIKN